METTIRPRERTDRQGPSCSSQHTGSSFFLVKRRPQAATSSLYPPVMAIPTPLGVRAGLSHPVFSQCMLCDCGSVRNVGGMGGFWGQECSP